MQCCIPLIILHVQPASVQVVVNQCLYTLKHTHTHTRVNMGYHVGILCILIELCFSFHDLVFVKLRVQRIIQATYILMAIHASQVKRSVPVVVLSICVCFIVQQQQLREQKERGDKETASSKDRSVCLNHLVNNNTPTVVSYFQNIMVFTASQFQR